VTLDEDAVPDRELPDRAAGACAGAPEAERQLGVSSRQGEKDMLAVIDLEKLLAIERATVEDGTR
jgi:hypothetical protein